MTDSSVKLSDLLNMFDRLNILNQLIKSCEKQQDRLKTKSKIKLISKLMIKFLISSADEELNKMLNFLYSYISDKMFFSNYD